MTTGSRSETDSPGQQEDGRHAETHHDAHHQEDREVRGDTGDDYHRRDEELRQKPVRGRAKAWETTLMIVFNICDVLLRVR